MKTQASDLSAKLLATENITVVRANAPTASFDIKSRVLTLPIWKDMTPEVEDMLVGHEVGHALYTGERYIEPMKETPAIAMYMNILEDVRIEKLLKRTYPGMRKRMTEGYRQLNERDFFGLSKVQSLEALLLIDRINLYFKAGITCGVKFNSKEKEFVSRAEHTETIDDVIKLAQEIFEFSKQEAESTKPIFTQTDDIFSAEDEDDVFDTGMGSGSETEEQAEEESTDSSSGSDVASDESEDGNSAPGAAPESDEIDSNPDDESDLDATNSGAGAGGNKPSVEELLQPMTYDTFNNKLNELADANIEYKYWKFDDRYTKDLVVGYKKILEESSMYSSYDEYDEFKHDSTRVVSHLVKEFEMRKSATLYKRAQVSKSGSLDMRKVYSYKLNEDLFKRVTILPEGKNHGMLMLLDWSGSMDYYLQDTIKQVINLAMFCQRAQLPFRVLAFTTEYAEREDYMDHAQRMSSPVDNPSNTLSNSEEYFRLLELFSDKMTSSEFQTMCRRVLHKNFARKQFSTGGTPLNQALIWVYQNIESYIKQNALEKMTFITLTDGDSRAVDALGGNHLAEVKNDYNQYPYKKIKVKNLIRDEVTKKTYTFNSLPSIQTKSLLEMIKDRYNVRVVGFYICRTSSGSLMEAIKHNAPTFGGDRIVLAAKLKEQIRKEGFASVQNTGRDDLFLIPSTSTKIEESVLEINSSNTARAIANQFGKFMNKKKTSRVLLNRFIDYVA